MKPANLLVRKVQKSWQVKLIDSIAGTWKYAAPEQLGELAGVAVSAASDVFAFGRTCYFALLDTPDPDDEEKDSLPEAWKKLLSRCTARRPDRRLSSFADVMQELDRLAHAGVEAARPAPG